MVGALVRDAVVAGGVAAVVSGVPSTLHALLTGRDPLESSRAAGRLLLRREDRTVPLLAAAATVHAALSLAWAVPVARALPRRHPLLAGGAAGLAIAALDLGLVGRRVPEVRRLHQPAQVADHLLYGVVVAAVVTQRRRSRLSGGPVTGALMPAPRPGTARA